MPELGRLSLPRGVREQVLLAVHVHPAQGATPPNQIPRVRGWKRGGVLKESIPEGQLAQDRKVKIGTLSSSRAPLARSATARRLPACAGRLVAACTRARHAAASLPKLEGGLSPRQTPRHRGRAGPTPRRPRRSATDRATVREQLRGWVRVGGAAWTGRNPTGMGWDWESVHFNQSAHASEDTLA